jgi:MFS transporter, SP family, arabinose:H+ symporter
MEGFFIHIRKDIISMNYKKIIWWSIIVAFGGFVFGFDTAVISGAEQEIQNLWNLSDTMIGQTVAMALYGTVIGALLGGFPSEVLGRKRTLVFGGNEKWCSRRINKNF